MIQTLIFFLFLSTSLFANESTIGIVRATWSGRDVTGIAGEFCDGKIGCQYKVSRRFIGNPANESDRSFAIVWICSAQPNATQSIVLSHDAENQRIDITCEQSSAVGAPPEVANTIRPSSDKNSSITGNLETENYYKNLINKYRLGQRLSIEEFKRTFYPVESISPSQDNMVRCKDSLPDGSCEPDTYYSWGPWDKITNIGRGSSAKGVWKTSLNLNRTIYLNHSSMATYCYGNYAVRFKFRKAPGKAPLNGQVMGLSFNEWWIRPNEILPTQLNDIESVSFGQPQHFDEIIAEIHGRLDNRKVWHQAPLYIPSRESNLKYKLLQGCVPERLPSSEEVLIENLVLFLEVIFNKQGWIHFNNCPQCTPADHFETKWKTFFNPN